MSTLLRSSNFFKVCVLACLAEKAAHAEEKNVWSDASVSFSINNGEYSPAQHLIEATFMEMVISSTAGEYLIIDAGRVVKYTRIFIQNRSDDYKYRLNNSKLCIGRNNSSPVFADGVTCSDFFWDGGFINVEGLPAGRFLYL